jgi:hypothetical protein
VFIDLPDWDREPAPWQPQAGFYARILELLRLRCTNDPAYERVMLDMARDIYRDKEVPQLINALTGLYVAALFGSVGQEVGTARVTADLAGARQTALKEAQ